MRRILRRKVKLPAPGVPKALGRKVPLPRPTIPRAQSARAKDAVTRAARRFRDKGRRGVSAPVPAHRVVTAAVSPGTGSVQGTVTDSVTTLPLANVCIYLYTAGGAYAGAGACTGGAGGFAIPDVAPGQYTVAAFDPVGTHPTTWYGNVTSQAAATTFAVVAGSVTSPVSVSMAQLTGITGRVGDSVTGGRVVGACIYASQTSGGTASYATCLGATGDTFAITGMDPGAYDVAFVDPAGLHTTVRHTATVVANRTTSGVDADMPQVTAIVGALVDAANSAPVPNGCVMLYAPGGGYVSGSYRCTDSQGKFVIDGIAPGRYLLAYYDPAARFQTVWFDGKPDQGAASVVTVTAGTITTVSTARVTTSGSATGIVRKADGTVAPDVCVYADDMAGQYTGVGTCSDATGRYTLAGLPTGQYKIAFYPPGSGSTSPYWYLQRSNELSATPITITGLQTTTLQDQILTVADDSSPPGPVTNVTTTSANTAVHLSWTNPSDGDFTGVTIRRAAGTVAPSSPSAGTAVAEVTKPGTSFDDTTVAAGQVYSYALFAHDAEPNYAPPASATVTASATPSAQHECGTLGASTTWSRSNAPVYVLDCAVTVAPNVTLTIAPGTVVKGVSGSSIVVQGSLVVSGTVADRVMFTSIRNDAVAGDTNQDGGATGPARGDWGGIATSAAPGSAAPSVLINRAAVSYANTGMALNGGVFSVRNSTVDRTAGDGINVTSPTGVPTVSGNTVTNVAAAAIVVQSAPVDMGALNGNSGSGNGLNGVQFSLATVAVSSSLPWTGTLLPVMYGGCSALRVPAGVTLTLGAGTIIKGQATSCAYLTVQGSLVANGTAASPVTLTSWRDDSVGGDTNGDGSATGPLRGDWGGVTAAPDGAGNPPPTVDLDHVKVAFAGTIATSQTTTSITNTTVDRMTGDGINVSSPIGVPTVSGNTVTNAAATAINILNAGVDMGALNGNSGTGNGLNGVQFSQDVVTVSSSLPWSGTLLPVLYGGCNALTVPAGVTLTLGAGTIIKGQSNSCAYFNVQGSLVANGTAASPVTLTSWRDDTIGGDTNGDGAATGPLRGDWGGISSSPPGNGNPNPTVSLSRVSLRYATTGLSLSGTTTSITDSTVDRMTGDGISVASPVGLPTVSGNTVTNAAGTAVNIVNANIDMGALNGNSGSGNGLNGVQFSQDTVTVSSSLPWSGNLVPVLYSGCVSLTVAPGITLTLGAGTIMKAQSNGCAYLNVLGRLVASGTAASPATITSWRDDTVGGDTNGDGAATGPQKGDWGGIAATPAGSGNSTPTLSLDRLNVRYATMGVGSSQTATSITHSTVDRMTGDGIYVSSPVGVPTVSDNTVTNAGGTAINILSANVDMGALNGNSGSGNGLNGVQFSQDVVTVSSSLPWSGTLLPVLYGGCNALTVPAGVTLTLGAGTIIKGQSNSCAYLNVQGSLIAAGTAATPVTLTSWRDDTIGGDTNGDGSATGPVRGDWGGISSSPAGAGNPNPTVDLEQVRMRYATSAIQTSQSSTRIVDSVVSQSTGYGIYVGSPVGVPTVTGNTITAAGGDAILVASASIDMGKLNGNSGSGNGLNGVNLASDTVTVSSSLPWTGNLVPVISSGCSSLTVPANVTLTLGAGTIIKGQAAGCSYFNVQGSLVARGTAASPVTLTSWRDDTIGGDTNGDGSATGPVRGDWGGISSSPAGAGNPNPTVDLEQVRMRYATSAIQTSQSSTRIVDSVVSQSTGYGIYVGSPVGVPTVTGNTITAAGGDAILVASASIDMGKLNGNSGSGNGLNGVDLASDTVTVSSSLPWTGNLVPVISSGCSSLTVPANVTLTLGAGTIIKGQAAGCSYFNAQGSLVARGTAASPVTLTSWRDDTIGGDTNGDGSATGPVRGDWGGISSSPAGAGNPNPTVDLEQVRMRYATSAIQTSQSSTRIVDSVVSQSTGYGIYVGSPVGVPTVTGNTITAAGGDAILVASASIDMGKLNGNSGSGNGLNGVNLASDTVTVSSSLPWTGNLVPVLGNGCAPLRVPTGVTLTLGAGTVIKGQACTAISVAGTLLGIGTPSSHVVLTSLRDDTVAGDTNADGGTTVPAPGDWVGVVATPAGGGTPDPTIGLQNTDIRYASVGIDVTQSPPPSGLAARAASQLQDAEYSPQVSISGSILHSTVGIASNDALVNATGLDWGHPSGPAPVGSGTLVQGDGVLYANWSGYVAPPEANPAIFIPVTEPNCPRVAFIGIRAPVRSLSADHLLSTASQV